MTRYRRPRTPAGNPGTGNAESRRAGDDGKSNAGRYANLFHSIGVICFELDYRRAQGLHRKLREDGVVDMAAHLAANPGFARQVMEAILVRDANDDAIAFIGARSRQQIIGRPIAPFWLDESSEECREVLIAGFGGASRFQVEGKLKTFHDDPRHVILTISGTPAMRKSGIVVASAVDITDRVSAHTALERMQNDFAHTSRVSVLGEMTATLAHEVNQPLAAIAASGAAALRWLSRPEPDVAAVTRTIRCIVQDAQRAADIIARTRRMASHKKPETTAVDVNALIVESLDFLHYEIGSRQATVATALATDLPPTRGDRTLLQQVVVNLLMNALQAMAAIDRGTRRIRVSSACSGNLITVSVQDSGPGIEAGSRARIFEGFYSTKTDGMGMGLAICRSIVERHGGRIRLDDACTTGARFCFTLPAIADPARTDI